MKHLTKFMLAASLVGVISLPLSVSASVTPSNTATTTPLTSELLQRTDNNLTFRNCSYRTRQCRFVTRCVRWFRSPLYNHCWVCNRPGFGRLRTCSFHEVRRLQFRGFFCHRIFAGTPGGFGRCAQRSTFRVCNWVCR